ncbi:MAG: nitrogenase molybdenum-iron protein subunit beta [Nitrospirae bacterium]|nr:nitrogenase molybdenum-iron protein subunit beta [Nitrospirota bacterium]
MKVKDHMELFQDSQYREMFERKQAFENPCSLEEIEKTLEWTKTWQYREKNFARKALVINPAKACQPLGAVLCALGFEKTLPFVHGSQGCVAYFRSHLSRHFKEPVAAVSTSMTEDAAVFGGLSNLLEGFENAYALYRPEMFAISTTCMAEVIGDDLGAFIRQAKDKGKIPQDIPTPFAHTPSFVGSHINGYDNMLRAILAYFSDHSTGSNDSINIIMGFDTYTGNTREIKRILNTMGIRYRILSDISDVLDSPNTGQYVMYPGGTPLRELSDAPGAIATVSLQAHCTEKTGELIKQSWNQQFLSGPPPIGIENTDRFLEEISRLTGRTIPDELEAERGRAVDAMVDSHPYIHGKRFALVGDPDLLLGLISFIMEMGGEPVHIVCTNGGKRFEEQAREILGSSYHGRNAEIYTGRDMWHLRSLLFTEPVDLIVGNSYAKFLWKDTGIPLVRIGFPIFDRHHLHRYPIVGYQGVINLVNWLVNTVLDEMDRASINTQSFDVIR